MATINVRQYTDLDLNFTIHPVKKDVNILKNEMAVIAAVKNLILTNHYERPFNPDLGSNVRRLLFEPLDMITASNLDREIRQTISNYEPRVTITALQVTPDYDNNGFGVYLQFELVNRSEPITVRFILERIR